MESAHRRSSLILVLAVLVLAIVSTTGVFGYRALFGVPPTLISKANKIAPVLMEAKSATNTNQAGTTTGSTEDLISPAEQSVKPEPRVIRTIPITTDQGWLRGAAAPTSPGAVQMAPNQAIPGPTSVWPPPPVGGVRSAMAGGGGQTDVEPAIATPAAPIPAPPAFGCFGNRIVSALADRIDR